MSPRKPAKPELSVLDSLNLAMDSDALQQGFLHHMEFTQGKDQYTATPLDFFKSAAFTTRDRMFDRWHRTQQTYHEKKEKWVYYLSLEFLTGRLLEDALINLGILEEFREAMAGLNTDLGGVLNQEWDMGLGNGGLGRLAACFLDSMAALGIPAVGYGIRYEYGIFKQVLVDGIQVEHPDGWLRYGNPWEIQRPERLYPVNFYGSVRAVTDSTGRVHREWESQEQVMALAHDVPVAGFRNDTVNTLRLWVAKSTREFNFSYFNRGDYIQAVEEKNITENITRVLYPNDSAQAGKELRLKQEYFFVSASLQDALARVATLTGGDMSKIPDHAVFQLNDTHPAIAVAELMRLLMDAHDFEWEEAWEVTRRSFAYTNHTVLPEALETWAVELIGRVLPRHLEIIYEINRRFMEDIHAKYPDDHAKLARMSLIAEGPNRSVRMAHLAIVGSFSVNGVSRLHTEILKERVFPDFHQHFPGLFNNKTNGITPRRWLLKCNPGLAGLLTHALGPEWVRDLDRLEGLVSLAEDPSFREAWRRVKRENKARLGGYIERQYGVTVDPNALFDVQVKRIHEYKRQTMNILHVISLYLAYKAAPPPAGTPPRLFLFAGKAAPAYHIAKTTIHLINSVARVVNADPAMKGLLKVVFLADYSVSLAEKIMPAADVSEQISLAGTEASGTGNMKLSLNGAVTIGTLDGANVEIQEAVGEENMFIFGLTAEQVAALQRQGYDPKVFYNLDPHLRMALDAVRNGTFSPDDPGRFSGLADNLMFNDPFMALADFTAYAACQRRVGESYARPDEWTRMSILNVAKMGRFSSDATIRRYAKEIWGVTPQPDRMMETKGKKKRGS
ncbi:MAG: glycogen/starch/alpha-glucan phosphorylase [Deltaproteobacteria bacterium]|nr:glycogen/starch/alpha-glucan phosphorylase [Deltaproteobacteria bacterium]MDH4122029.1 glycogen/starch/alpha-glucan phosphorylase [Deltaproteobacteria bacterium]